ncbi:MAG: DcaP family trimeric outer membrane transporter [Candidatus Eiseniibacteriota bacterium]
MVLALGLVVAFSGTAFAQTRSSTARPAASAFADSAEVSRLRKLIEEQAALLESQKKALDEQIALGDAQQDSLKAQARRIEEFEQRLLSMNRRIEELEEDSTRAVAPPGIDERLKRIEEATKAIPELPPDVVSAGDFPGSIRIPGTDAAVKFGGRIRTAYVFTLDPLGTTDRFLTNSIPVGDSAIIGEDNRTEFSARASRVNIEFRTPTGHRQVRAFFEGDFAGNLEGNGNGFRLRHAYAQWEGLIIGQTWSTFSDPEADVQDLDFEGISSENVTRQPQLRYSWRPRPNVRTAFALETPEVSVTNGTGVNVIPDFIGRLYWTYPKNGHLQTAVVLRQVRGEPFVNPGDTQSSPAWGVSVSGVVPLQPEKPTDRVIFQVNIGGGISRYINDLSSLGGEDGFFDPTTGELSVTQALGWYADYEHTWHFVPEVNALKLRSSFIWSYVNVENLDAQPSDAYNRTSRFSANLIASPNPRVDLGAQFIYGTRRNKNGEEGSARQIQVVAIFLF